LNAERREKAENGIIFDLTQKLSSWKGIGWLEKQARKEYNIRRKFPTRRVIK
jgi:hypothetical protein